MRVCRKWELELNLEGPELDNFSCSITSSRTQIVPSFLSRSLWPLGVAPLTVPKWLL